MARFAAFLDACTLVPVVQCDTLLRLADAGLFRPLWSWRVQAEALSALKRVHPEIDPSRFHSRLRSMNEAFVDANVEAWESLVDGIVLPDMNDRHVVAAAIRGRADAIVTANLKDFPYAALQKFELEAIGVDDFLLDQLDLAPAAVCDVLLSQVCAMTQPPITPKGLLERLSRSGSPGFATAAYAELERRRLI
ncbi:PIN domain-containing protein [Leucobacter sp. HY1910]